jgi:hypothetical protein
VSGAPLLLAVLGHLALLYCERQTVEVRADDRAD